jgi:hypothetical protein
MGATSSPAKPYSKEGEQELVTSLTHDVEYSEKSIRKIPSSEGIKLPCAGQRAVDAQRVARVQ